MEPGLGLPGTNATTYFCPQLLGHKFCPGTTSRVSGGRRLGFRNDSTFLLQSGVKLWLGLLALKPDCGWDLVMACQEPLVIFPSYSSAVKWVQWVPSLLKSHCVWEKRSGIYMGSLGRSRFTWRPWCGFLKGMSRIIPRLLSAQGPLYSSECSSFCCLCTWIILTLSHLLKLAVFQRGFPQLLPQIPLSSLCSSYSLKHHPLSTLFNLEPNLHLPCVFLWLHCCWVVMSYAAKLICLCGHLNENLPVPSMNPMPLKLENSLFKYRIGNFSPKQFGSFKPNNQNRVQKSVMGDTD